MGDVISYTEEKIDALLLELKQSLETLINAKPDALSVTYSNLPAGTTLTIVKSGSSWPARPTSRSDIVVAWKGPDPSPAIVTSGTAGMRDNIDYRLVTP